MIRHSTKVTKNSIVVILQQLDFELLVKKVTITINVVSSNLAQARRCTRTILCDKVCQRHAAGRWFSLGILVSSTNKTNSHDITEILLKVALNTITHNLYQKVITFLMLSQSALIYVLGFSVNTMYIEFEYATRVQKYCFTQDTQWVMSTTVSFVQDLILPIFRSALSIVLISGCH